MKRFFLTCCLGLAAAPCLAAPFVPVSDDTVVQTLPYRLSAAVRSQVALPARSTALPLAQAVQAAQAAIERGRQHGDPRELGLAQALLQPWWAQPEPPPTVRLLRATVNQGQHAFDAALRDLDALALPGASGLAPVPLPVQAQALLTRATVHQVQGRLALAQADCQTLAGAPFHAAGPATRIAAQACLAELQSLRGQASEGQRALAGLAQAAGPSPWLALVQAELAERQGDAAAAAALYPGALQGSHSVYARAAYADWLLGQRRWGEVLALLPADAAQADALLLRRAIALKHLPAEHAREAAAAAATLDERFAAARRRGQNEHAREEARFQLDVQGQSAAALALAQRNWQLQKEPADAVLLARAALAAGQPQALAPLQAFVREHRWADVRLSHLDRSLQP